MGGTGVASARYSSGVLINPALLAKGKPDDGVAIMLPSAWGQVTSLGNIEHHIDTIAYRVNKYKYAIDELKIMNLLYFGKTLKRYRNAAGDLADALSQLDDKTVHANAAAGVAVSIPLDEFSVAFVTKARLHAGLSSAIDPSYIAYLRSIQNSDAVAMKEVTSAMMGGSKQLTEKLRSMAFGRGSIIVDYGVDLARQFDIGGLPVSFGVTPKVQRVQLYNYSGSIYSSKISDFNYRRYRQSETEFNLDAGVAVDVTDNWTIGVSGQNLASRNIDTRVVNGYEDTYQIHPLVTAGMAWNSTLLTLSADVDITETKRFLKARIIHNMLVWGQKRVRLAGSRCGQVTASTLTIAPTIFLLRVLVFRRFDGLILTLLA